MADVVYASKTVRQGNRTLTNRVAFTFEKRQTAVLPPLENLALPTSLLETENNVACINHALLVRSLL